MSNLNDGGVAWNPIANLIMEVMQAALPGPLIFLSALLDAYRDILFFEHMF